MTGTAAPRQHFLGLDFDALELDDAALIIAGREAGARFAYVVTPNVDHIVQLDRSRDPGLAAAYSGAWLLLCDSRILAALARISRVSLPVVAGSDLTAHLLENHDWAGRRLAVIGGDVALHLALRNRYPQVNWQFFEPPRRVRHDPRARAAIADFVETCGADVLFFAIGAPQSEICCREIAARGTAVGTALCIGASLEFLVGAKPRAPRWMRHFGLEWLFRLSSEPRRLWRRYLVEGPKIFRIWWRLKRSHHRDRSGSTRSGGE